MLPKRSTLVDQTLESESVYSQFSVDIFIAPRNLLGARKSIISVDNALNLPPFDFDISENEITMVL